VEIKGVRRVGFGRCFDPMNATFDWKRQNPPD
jgi:hypothetical protein